MRKVGTADVLLPLISCATYAFLYVPIILVVLFSFNASDSSFAWSGFTLDWYRQLYASVEMWDALKNSLIIALSAVVLSTVMGLMLVFFYARGPLDRFLTLFYANVAVPEIVLAVGLMTFFYMLAVPLGIVTLIAVHTVLGLGYVVPILYARFMEIDERMMEASLDLGATRAQTFFKIIFPQLMPAVIAGAMLVFIISFDDFVLSFFCAGGSTQTIPMYIFSRIKAGASPMVGALSTLLLVSTGLTVLGFSSLRIKKTDVIG